MTNPTIRWQHHKMDRMLPMLPVGTTSTSPAVQCEPTGPQYVLAVDHDAEVKELRSALKVAQQSLLEFSLAQERGPSWYTRGEQGMYSQVSLWLRRGLEAVQGALGPYDDNGQYLKDMPAAEPGVAQAFIQPEGEPARDYRGMGENPPVKLWRDTSWNSTDGFLANAFMCSACGKSDKPCKHWPVEKSATEPS
jgi:hypothetical protein